ncbi:MAG TPA: asparaginase [Caldimonas sp.]|nr:asparaginase [Caldimonas sp.]
MQSPPRRVVVLGTGGTIAGWAATPTETLAYRSAQLGVAELVAAAPSTADTVVESEQVAQLDSKDMDFATWRRLALRVAHHLARPEVAGVVVTHGTDTLEETAWFLARVVDATKPVVLTAAMRPASALDADGPGNLADAISLAGRAGHPGVVVTLAGAVHGARDVRKAHPQRPDAFTSGDAGPLARHDGTQWQWLRDAAAGPPSTGVDLLPEDESAWPWVEVVTSDAGADGRVVDLLAGAGVDGIVVAATGNGSTHRLIAAALARAQASGVVVRRSSRCVEGAIVETGNDGLPTAGGLSPVKARIELMLHLLCAGRPARSAERQQESGRGPRIAAFPPNDQGPAS